jgi:hypothetical protein
MRVAVTTLAGLGELEPHVIDTSRHTAEETAHVVRRQARTRAFVLGSS